MDRLVVLLGVAAAALPGCGRERPGPVWPGALCTTRLPDAALASEDAPALTQPTSRVLVEIRVETEAMLAALEAAVPRRVAERRGLDLGAPGKLDFHVDRGKFRVRVAGDELAVEVDLEGDAALCKPMGALGCVGYASCQPSAHAHAAVPLLLGSDFRLPSSRVGIPITRRCMLTALSIDVTGEVEAEAKRREQAIRESIDAGVPAVEPVLREIWQALGTSVPLGAGTCARVYPTALVQTGPRVRGGAIRLVLGAEGQVVVETPCAPAQPAPPMPSPRLDRTLEPGVDLRVPVIVGWDEASRAIARGLAQAEPAVGGEVVHVTDARVQPTARGVRIGLTIAGKTCGEVWLDGVPAYDATRGAIVFQGLTPAGDAAGLARAGIDGAQLAASVAPLIAVPLRVDPANVPKRIDRIAASLLGPTAGQPADGPEIAVGMTRASIDAALAVREGLVAMLHAEGAATVKLR